jgi:hypothetical protein
MFEKLFGRKVSAKIIPDCQRDPDAAQLPFTAGWERIEFRFADDAPFEVLLNAGGDITWRFARDLLIEALDGVPAGLGDVRIYPDSEAYLRIILQPSTEECATLIVPRKQVADFINATLGRVPRGAESIDPARFDRYLMLAVAHQFASDADFVELVKDL